MITIRKGLDVPIAGTPEEVIEEAVRVRRIAILGADFVGLRPAFRVAVGDRVRRGQTLLEDRRTPGVRHTAPGTGTVSAINRGERRVFRSLVIDLDEHDDEADVERLPALDPAAPHAGLVRSGLWTALRTRPYSRTPSPESPPPHSIFVTAMESDPLAPPADLIIGGDEDAFASGLEVVTRLTDGPVFVCTTPTASLPGADLERVRVVDFDGPHPAGLPGTHIHFLDPVDMHKTVWHVGYQDVIAIGRLFGTGVLPVERVISLAGPVVSRPRLLRTRLGASIDELVEDQIDGDAVRVLSGSVLSGRVATGPEAFLGRFHRQVCAISDDVRRPFLGWLGAGFRRFSAKPVYASAVTARGRRFAMTTAVEGSPRPIFPIGSYERVMPLDLVVTELLKSLASGSDERAQDLGCLELDEEDLALCGFVCPGKYDYGPLLRETLARIEREG